MKLSEAIRLGSLLRPCKPSIVWEEEGSCSIGAALEAVGQHQRQPDQTYFDQFKELWPWAKQSVTEWPKELTEIEVKCFNLVGYHYWSAISLLTIHWKSRERVAAWVATVEPQDDPAQVEEEVRDELTRLPVRRA